MSSKDKSQAPPRVRLAKHIDLDKAKPGCKRCGGSGVNGYRRADLDDGKGVRRIPVICRCVSRGGGVQKDQLDRISEEAQHQMATGVFHENMAADIRRLPHDAKVRAVASLMMDMVSQEKSRAAKDAVNGTLSLLMEDGDWGEVRGGAMKMLMRDANDVTLEDDRKKLAARAMSRVRQSMN